MRNSTEPTRLAVMCIASATLLAVAACGNKDAPAPVTVASVPDSLRMTSIAKYPLTSENVAKAVTVASRLRTMMDSDPSLRTQLNGDSSVKEVMLDEAAARFEGVPRLRELFRDVGITPRDYLYTRLALAEADMAYHINMSGHTVADGSRPVDIIPANLDFVAKHQAEVKALNGAGGLTPQ